MIRSSGAIRIATFATVALFIVGCQANNKPKLILSEKSPVELRAIQTRAFDTTDKTNTMRSVVATFQDLGYSVDKVETTAGTVTATKLANLRMTATVYSRTASQLAVRSNAILLTPGMETQVDDPEFYQRLFFEPLSKAMFLNAVTVDGAEEGTAPAAAQSTAPKKP